MASIAELETKLDGAATGLSAVTAKKMFGCRALFRDGKIFAMVWKEGRIGFKLLDDASFVELMAMKGAGPWSPGGKMKMSHWVLVPPAMNADAPALREWARRAHASALSAPAKAGADSGARASAKTSAGKKVAGKKAVGKTSAKKSASKTRGGKKPAAKKSEKSSGTTAKKSSAKKAAKKVTK